MEWTMINDLSVRPFPPVIRRIGRTPLIELVRTNPFYPRVRIFAKAEWFNPGGSVKDRAAWFMIRAGLKSGQLNRNKTILEATSGNTGIALALIGAVLGISVEIIIPANASKERLQILQWLGARVILTDPLGGTDEAQVVARERYRREPERYFYPDQYNNPWNPMAHEKTTAPEIIRQTRGRITHFVAGLGTTGTFVGTTRRLKKEIPGIRCIAFQPDSPLHALEGLKHLPTARVPGIYDPSLVDEMLTVRTEDALAMVDRIARLEGWFIGPSSGAAAWAALQCAETLTDGVIVTLFPDSGWKYLDLLSSVRTSAGNYLQST